MFISSGSLKPSLLAVATSALILTGCGGDGSSNDDGETGKVSMSVTDAPVNSALGVYVQFSGVVLIKDDETQEELTFDEPKQINLLDYQAGNSVELFTDFEVEAGEYSQIRLMVDTEGNNDTYISFADGSFELEIPSGEQTGLKLVSGFTVTADESVSFMLDFDLRKAITVTGNGEYKLRPTIRLIDLADYGSITGTLSSELCNSEDTKAVYVYEGEVTEPDDLGTDGEPVATASVDAELSYTASYLTPGDYTVAVTCQAELDDPEVDDEEFGQGEGFSFVSAVVTIETDGTVTVNANPE